MCALGLQAEKRELRSRLVRRHNLLQLRGEFKIGHAHRVADRDQFDCVHLPLAEFALGNIRLRFTQTLRQFRLREARRLARFR